MISQNSSFESCKLVNFNVPNYLIRNFDNLVKFKGMNRTTMLIHLMESYIRSEKRLMEDEGTINRMIVECEERNSKRFKNELKKIRDQFEDDLPSPIIRPSERRFDPFTNGSGWFGGDDDL